MSDEPETTENEEASSRKQDSEIKVIASILRQLNEIEEDARKRVITYLADRFKP